MCLTLNVLVCLPPPLFMFFSHKGYILNIHLEYSCRRQSDFIVRIKPICILHKRLSYPPSHGPSHPHPHDFYTLILSPTTISFTTSTFRVKHVLYNYKLFQVTVQGLMQKGSAFRKLTWWLNKYVYNYEVCCYFHLSFKRFLNIYSESRISRQQGKCWFLVYSKLLLNV